MENDGTPSYCDIIKDKQVRENGDIKFSLVRTPLKVIQKQQYDWKLSIDIAGGGLVETDSNEQYHFNAPEQGYHSVVVEMKATDKPWTNSVSRFYYMKAREGQIYGYLIMLIWAKDNAPSEVYIRGFYNNEGSRHFEATDQ